MKCKKCLYSWESRVKEPKACPRCKNRLDYDLIKEPFLKRNAHERNEENYINRNLKEVM